jgi:hypothetical protein
VCSLYFIILIQHTYYMTVEVDNRGIINGTSFIPYHRYSVQIASIKGLAVG